MRVLQKKWVTKLHEQLSKVLNNYGRLPEVDAEEEPKLVTWLVSKTSRNCKKYISIEISEIFSTRKCAANNARKYLCLSNATGKKFIWKFLKQKYLQDDYYKIVDVASELVDCLDRIQLGQPVSKSK